MFESGGALFLRGDTDEDETGEVSVQLAKRGDLRDLLRERRKQLKVLQQQLGDDKKVEALLALEGDDE